MQVYVELALAENFCMDFTLLGAAKLLTKNICGYKRICAASALGACFAVAFPLFNLNGAWAVAVKILSGLVLALSACRINGVKGCIKFTCVFLGLSAALGGALIAVFSLTGWEYSKGGGYIISSVPVGIPLFFAFVLFLACKKLSKRAAANKNSYNCTIYFGGKSVSIGGFFDSGNRLYSGGAPVSIVPLYIAEQLVSTQTLTETVKMHTATGSKKIKIFTAEKIEIYNGKDLHTIKSVKIGISPRNITAIVLHPDLSAFSGEWVNPIA